MAIFREKLNDNLKEKASKKKDMNRQKIEKNPAKIDAERIRIIKKYR